MIDFFPIQTPYDSKDYQMMKNVINMGIDSNLEGFVKSEFKKSPHFNNKFLWNIHETELPILYKRLEKLYDKTGDEDYESLLNDIKAAQGSFEETTSEIDEMIDPYDPMDYNQTIDGQPTATSDLAIGGVDTASPDSGVAAGIPYDKEIEDFIDDDTIGQELEISEAEIREMIKNELHSLSNTSPDGPAGPATTTEIPSALENSSDSLANKHGMNSKPETLIDESYGDRYEQIVFMQGQEADEVMDILNNDGQEAALNHLIQWHYPEEHDGSNELGAGTQDRIFKKDGYIMNWNPFLPYIGLVYDTEHTPETVDEDSQIKRHQAGQRDKIGNIPLGQHAPNKISININKK